MVVLPALILVGVGVKLTSRAVKHQVKKSKNKKMVAAIESGNSPVESQQLNNNRYIPSADEIDPPPAYAEKPPLAEQETVPVYEQEASSSQPASSSQGIQNSPSQLIGSTTGKYSSIDVDFSKITKIIVNHGKAIRYISFMDDSETSVYKIGTPSYGKEFAVISLPNPSEQIIQIKFAFYRRELIAMTFITNTNRVETIGTGSPKARYSTYDVPANSNIVRIESYSGKTINGLRLSTVGV